MALFTCKYGEICKNSNFVQLMGLVFPYTVKSTYTKKTVKNMFLQIYVKMYKT